MKEKTKVTSKQVFQSTTEVNETREFELADYTRMEEELDQQKEEQVSLTKYTDMVSKLESGKYDRSTFLKWKKDNSRGMDDIISSTKLLGNLLNMEIEKGDDLDGIIEDIKKQYSAVKSFCAAYIDSHEPKTKTGKARLEIVRSIMEQLVADSRDIEVNFEILKREGMDSDIYKDTKKNKLTWSKVLLRPHEISIKTGGNITVEGAEKYNPGTSQMMILHEGEKTYFFKKKEHIPDHTKKGVFAFVLHKYEKDLKELEKGDEGDYRNLTPEQREEARKKIILKVGMFKKTQSYLSGSEKDAIGLQKYDSDMRIKQMIKQCGLNEEEQAIAKEFTKDFSGLALGSEMAFVSGIEMNSDLTKRNEATSIMADVLGISDIMMKSERVTLDIDGKKIEGLRMEEVKGESYRDGLSKPEILDKKLRYTPEAFANMMKMQVFDIICGQMDRNLGNYMIQSTIDEDAGTVLIKSICGIDNDMSFGTLSYQELLSDKYLNTEASRKHKNLEDAEGNILLMGIDQAFAEKILALSPAVLYAMMGKLLSDDERAALADRLKGVQQVILKMLKEDENRPENEKRVVSSMTDWQRIYDKQIEIYNHALQEAERLEKLRYELDRKKDAYKEKLIEQLTKEGKKKEEASDIVSDRFQDWYSGEDKVIFEIENAKSKFMEEWSAHKEVMKKMSANSYLAKDAFSDKGMDTFAWIEKFHAYQKEQKRAKENKA